MFPDNCDIVDESDCIIMKSVLEGLQTFVSFTEVSMQILLFFVYQFQTLRD